MKEGPDIALLGALIGDPARANMLTALMSGKALTASELAAEAGVTLQTASSHLGKMEIAGLLHLRKQGRHRYFSLADDDVGGLLEVMMGLAAKKGHVRTRTGPKDPALRKARVCYNHLAGEMGVRALDSMIAAKHLVRDREDLALTRGGVAFLKGLDIDAALLEKSRRPLCKSCLDWSARRSHLAGSIGTALLDRFYDLGWATRLEGSRIVAFSASGEKKFLEHFPLLRTDHA
ncbi:winged helix-turn-helix domain-containing protein [Sneathiella marina]|uniref:Winged helix-turn-helix domain-containing protein n=1 Tax=Sneathiella marina TaxID=2950108 RepID=A0ABY4W718_9PROT|nr:winged helix-turn-helix domain-containing protein [Sneathiella marina]USG60446.1 winged helix-turn-helix domain-containing protein [Sneathiella marina]